MFSCWTDEKKQIFFLNIYGALYTSNRSEVNESKENHQLINLEKINLIFTVYWLSRAREITARRTEKWQQFDIFSTAHFFFCIYIHVKILQWNRSFV